MTPRRVCARCNKGRSPQFFASVRARVCLPCQKSTKKATDRVGRVRRTYNLSAEDHAALVELQGGVCAICGGKRTYALNVDHDHATGAVRGLLCRADNKLLAIVRDDIERLQAAVEYLRQPPAAVLDAIKEGGIG